MPAQELLSPGQATDLLACSKSTVLRAIKRGEIPAFKLGRTVRIPVQRLLEVIEVRCRDDRREPKRAAW